MKKAPMKPFDAQMCISEPAEGAASFEGGKLKFA
jgi:hypothetical protein